MRKLSRGSRTKMTCFCAAAAMILSSGFSGLSYAGNKPVDWDKELVKVRNLIDTNNIEEAMKLLDKQLKKHPDAAQPHVDLGKCYKKRGKLSLARSEFRRATEVDPNYAESWYELGSMYQVDKEWQLAVTSFEKYLALAPYSERKDQVKDRINFCKSQLAAS